MDAKAIVGDCFCLMLILGFSYFPQSSSSNFPSLPGILVLDIIASYLFVEEAHTFLNTAHQTFTSKKLLAGHRGNFSILSCLVACFFLSCL